MRTSALVAAAAAAVGVTAQSSTVVTGTLGNATIVVGNPTSATYVATLPSNAFDAAAFPNGGNVKGQIVAAAKLDGTGIQFQVQFSNLPAVGGPFTYHIHAKPVPENGNCTATAGHLDPFDRKDEPACDRSLPQTCQVGDLSGKHGKINVTDGVFSASYVDPYTSTRPDSPEFFGNLSFVLHYPNKTRITCANFVLQASGSTSNSTLPSGNATITATPTGSSATAAVSTAAASVPHVASLAAGAAGILAAAMLL